MVKQKPMELFFPGITGKDIRRIYELKLQNSQGIFLLAFCLAWRSQLTVILDELLEKSEIQQMESQKFIAKIISTNILIKKHFAAIAITRTLNFEFEELSKLSTDKERSEYLLKIINTLAENSPPRGVKKLPPGNITKQTLEKHRYGIMAQQIGLCQSKPIYDPRSIIKGGAISNIDIESFLNLFNTTINKLIGENINEEDIETIRDNIDLPKPPIFNDAIGIGSSSNKAPLEAKLEFERTKPISPIDLELEEGEKSPFLINAKEQSDSYNLTLKDRGLQKPKSIKKITKFKSNNGNKIKKDHR